MGDRDRARGQRGLGDGRRWSERIDAATLELPVHRFRLIEPAAFAWDDGAERLAVEAHSWRSEDVDLWLEDDIAAGPDGSAVLGIERYPLARLDPFLPAATTLEGVVDIEALHVVFEPLDFIARLAALVPKPRVNLTRFHGVFTPPHSRATALA